MTRKLLRYIALPVIVVFVLSSWSYAQEVADPAVEAAADEVWTEFDDPFAEEETTIEVSDPIEPFNRGMFWLNDKLYFYLFKPIARGLRVIPEPARISASNFFSNLSTPVRFGNALLQLKMEDAGTELARFLVNTTVGVGGLFDPAAQSWKLPKKKEDLGQTLGHYGVGSGFYLVLPVLGPSNLRDTVGFVGDRYLDPLTYMLEFEDKIVVRVVERENQLSLDEDTYEEIKKQSIDPYLTVRNAYTQRRAGLIRK